MVKKSLLNKLKSKIPMRRAKTILLAKVSFFRRSFGHQIYANKYQHRSQCFYRIHCIIPCEGSIEYSDYGLHIGQNTDGGGGHFSQGIHIEQIGQESSKKEHKANAPQGIKWKRIPVYCQEFLQPKWQIHQHPKGEHPFH